MIRILFLAALCTSAVRAQTLTNGGNHDRTILPNQTNSWTFTATNGDRIVLRGAALTATNYFNPWLRIYNPNGVLIGDSGGGSSEVAEELALTATNGGTFTVLVSDTGYGGLGGTWAYRLYFAQFPGAFVVPAGDEGGPLTNGGNHDGTVQLGDLDLWSFTASTGDRVVVRIGALTATNYFNPWLRIYGRNGVLIADSGGGNANVAEELALTATNGGTFTVLVSDTGYGGFGGTGAYRLYFAQFPGVFVVPSGDEGGALTSGSSYNGTVQVGDLDLWSFSASAGDRVVARIGMLTATNYFNPWMRIYNPNGVLIADSGGGDANDAEELAITATNSGTFTVLVSDTSYGGFGGTGDYRLYFAQFPGAFIVPAGDEGGPLTSGVEALGTIQVGDLDLWRFVACRGDYIDLRIDQLSQTNYFNPWLRLYNPGGILIADSGSGNANVAEELALTATNSGVFTILVSDTGYGGFGGSGTYRLSSNGLFDGLRACLPIISGTNVSLGGVGGISNATYVLFTHTNVSTPLAQWMPIRTNQFDANGVFSYTNLYNPAEKQRYFRLRSP